LLVPREKQGDARTWPQPAGRAALSAAIVTLPLVLWNTGAFWESVVWLQVKQSFRHDALSFLAALSDEERAQLHTLLVRLADGAVWCCSADGTEWKNLATIQLPPR
jgi:hypothetical protein